MEFYKYREIRTWRARSQAVVQNSFALTIWCSRKMFKENQHTALYYQNKIYHGQREPPSRARRVHRDSRSWIMEIYGASRLRRGQTRGQLVIRCAQSVPGLKPVFKVRQNSQEEKSVKPFSILFDGHRFPPPAPWERSKRDWIIRSNARSTSCTTMRGVGSPLTW